MLDDPCQQLTDKQKDCLRLVLLGYGSKEIASILGVSFHTVDARLKKSLAICRTASRFEAARMLAEYEGLGLGGLVYQPLAIPNDGAQAHPPRAILNDQGSESSDMVGTGASFGWLLPLPSVNQPVASFTPVQKLMSILAIALGTVVLMGVILTSYESLSNILRGS